MANLKIKNVQKIYKGGYEALKDFNLEINDKEFVVLVGPSGCGKSTILRMIAGLEEISSGQIEIDGRVVNNVEPKDRDISMVFQNYALYPHMNVYDNMAFSLNIRKVDKASIDKKVMEAADILGLKDLLKRKPSQLSGGQRQRVALGRAIVRNPKVFLMDEPLSNLDAKLRMHMRTEISKMHNSLGATTIYVTHDQTEAMTMGDKIVVLDNGVIQQVGSPREIYDDPQNIFVAKFIGSPSINILNLDVKDGVVDIYGQKITNDVIKNKNPNKILLGIRPENIEIINGEDFLITLVENLGSEKYIYLEPIGVKFVKEDNLVVKVHNSLSFNRGEKVSIKILNPEKINFFNIDSEEKY